MTTVLGRFAHHTDEKVERLADIPLFRDVSRRQPESMAPYLDMVSVGPDTTLVREGRHNGAFWVLLEGEVELWTEGGDRHVLGPGEVFGVSSMLDGRPAVATVRTLTPIHALVASAAQFRALKSNRVVAARLLSTALRRVRESLEARQRQLLPAA